MARPIKYNWSEIVDHFLAGLSRQDIELRYGCSQGRISEELKKRGISEPDSKMVLAKDAIVSAVSRVSEITETITESQKNSVINVAAHESGYVMLLQRAASAGIDKGLALLQGVSSMTELKSYMDAVDKGTAILAPEHKSKANAQTQQPITAVQVNLKVVK